VNGYAVTAASKNNFAKDDARNGDSMPLPLSVAPSLTVVALLKLVACLLLGALVIFYPFSKENAKADTIYEILVRAVLASGLLLSFVGLLEDVISNGKPLWVFTPYDFHGQDIWKSRAFGSFANADHYACFLAMLLPPALAGIIFPGLIGRVRERAAVPLLSGVVAVVIIAALLATASRGGMLNAFAGVTTLGVLSSRLPTERQPSLLRSKGIRHTILAAGTACLLITAVYVAGASNRIQANSRLKRSFSDGDFATRLVPARNTLNMISDFPLFGVGLGAWPDIYRKYTKPPWSPVFMNATHDEYVQFVAETGAVGFLLVAATIVVTARRARSRLFGLPSNQFAVVASFIASLVGLGVHAALDFPLRIPAIAVLSTIMGAVVIRALLQEPTDCSVIRNLSPKGVVGAAGITVVLVALMWSVSQQSKVPYPYNLRAPRNYREMADLLLAHPTNSRVHLTLIGFLPTDLPLDTEMAELRTIIALEPNNPISRDMYLQQLAQTHQNAAALSEMSKSVFYAPSASDHFYLSSTWVPKLTSGERDAIEIGLRDAVRERFDGAVGTLGEYYGQLGEFRKEATLFVQAAQTTLDSDQKVALLNHGGLAFAKTGDYPWATKVLREAIYLRPDGTEAYENLGFAVYLPSHDIENARLVIRQGIRAGADPARLYLKLAEVDRAANDRDGEEEALKQAAASEPFSYQISYSLGIAYLQDGRSDAAVLWLRKAAEANPTSADIVFTLAQAEESAYQFFAARDDYTKALELEPSNALIRHRFQQFKERLAVNGRTN
jgi:tetratricopeptide (TPR) repeat protein